MGRLRQLLFGPHTEKTDSVLPSADFNASAPASNQREKPIGGQPRRGHGRHGASDYSGAQNIKVAHPKLQPGDTCPDCAQGKLYGLPQTSPLLRIVAQPIFPASLYQLEKLRCNLCGQVASDSVSPTAKEDIARYLCNWLGDGNIREVLVCFRRDPSTATVVMGDEIYDLLSSEKIQAREAVFVSANAFVASPSDPLRRLKNFP